MGDGRVLVLDDEEVVRKTLSSILESEGWKVDAIADPEEALKLVDERDYLMAITDVMMPKMTGLEFQRYVRARRPDLPMLVMTGYPTIERAVEALRDGAINFLTKPFDMTHILKAVERAAQTRRVLETNAATQQFIVDDMQMEIPSTIEHVNGAIHYIVDRSLLPDAWPRNAAFQIRLTLDEAMANALEHGNKYDASKKIRVHVKMTAKRFEATVEDEGEGFDPAKVADPVAQENLEAMLEGGRGVFLMRCYMDGVEYNERGNRLHMWKDNAESKG